MAKISNQTSYPAITPVAGDYLVLTDVSDDKKTKTVTVQALADFVDGEVTLQEVLDASDVGVSPPTAVAIGSITLTGTFASPAGSDVIIKTLGATDDIELSAGGTSGRISLSGAGIFGEAEDVSWTATVGDIDLSAIGASGDIKIKAGDRAIMSANGTSYGGQPAGTAMLYNQNDDVHINANNGRIIIGGSYPSKPIKIDIGPSSGDIDIWAFDNVSNINLTASTGKIESHSTHDFSFNNGIFLAGVAGVAGEVIASEGAGAPLAWRTPLSLLPLPISNVYTGVAGNIPAATDKITIVHGVPPAGTPDITIGKLLPQTYTSLVGQFYPGVTHPLGVSNLSYGLEALEQFTLSGSMNTGIGLGALSEVTVGNENTGVGFGAGAAIQGTVNNTAVGANALRGAGAGTIGNDNTAIGAHSLENMNAAAADRNVAVGTFALGAVSSGSYNIGIGHDAGISIMTGGENICIGKDTMLANGMAAVQNIVIGNDAGGTVASSLNTIIGTQSTPTLQTGTTNVLIGALTDVLAFADSGAVAVGAQSHAGALSVTIGQGSIAEQGGTSLGQLAVTQPRCVALGQGASGIINPATNNPVINISLWAEMTTAALAHVFTDNTAALAGGLSPGDLYCLDPTQLGFPVPPNPPGTTFNPIGAGGPAIICVVYQV